jgi:hypothetical protein
LQVKKYGVPNPKTRKLPIFQKCRSRISEPMKQFLLKKSWINVCYKCDQYQEPLNKTSKNGAVFSFNGTCSTHKSKNKIESDVLIGMY